jgi:hypothetical protein
LTRQDDAQGWALTPSLRRTRASFHHR